MTEKWTDNYPRPQMVRQDWLSLDGEWIYNEDETIIVPFCPESELSGIGRRIAADGNMVYERDFDVPGEWDGRRVLLHFGAVDQIANVYVNNADVGTHEGGYLPFSFDVTEFINFEEGKPHQSRGCGQTRSQVSVGQAEGRQRRHVVYSGIRHLAERLGRAGA